QIAFLLSPQASAKEITVVKKYHPHIGLVWMDPEKIKQVIINLLSNALEFIPEGGRIEIITTLVKEKKKNPGLCIIINDNGPGIPQSIIPKIFDPYFTTKHKGSLYNGTGLGLFIAYQNILDHQGTIEVESTVDVGTKFTIFLPTSRPEHYESITPGS
ncbi:MAG: hypothetical protein C0407_18505, partial [Desulfobacca sp.]|nr:hypothetical protein [Desulfobacca sp.]